jgi:acetyl-CoA carboxylase biotin carboxyl carrier protein
MPRKQPKPQPTVRQDEGTSLDVEALRQIVEILEASEVTRLVWTNGRERVAIRRGAPTVVQAPSAPVPVHGVGYAGHAPSMVPASANRLESRPQSVEGAGPPSSQGVASHVITSPFVGTFYRSPAPDQPSFAEVGSIVKKGQVLCIVEAMKLMNEIESEVSGKVVEVLAQNAQPVEFGQPLFRIEPA